MRDRTRAPQFPIPQVPRTELTGPNERGYCWTGGELGNGAPCTGGDSPPWICTRANGHTGPHVGVGGSIAGKGANWPAWENLAGRPHWVIEEDLA